jgi:hypothetical protein
MALKDELQKIKDDLSACLLQNDSFFRDIKEMERRVADRDKIIRQQQQTLNDIELRWRDVADSLVEAKKSEGR